VLIKRESFHTTFTQILQNRWLFGVTLRVSKKPTMNSTASKLAFALSLASLLSLTACGGDGTSPASSAATATGAASAPVTASSADTASAPSSASAADTASAPASASAPDSASSPVATTQPGIWATAKAGDILDVTLADLRPTQAALGYDQIYYKLGRYEADYTKKFDDFCADEGLDGLKKNTATSSSKLTDASTYTCKTTDTTKRDTTVLNPVVVGPNGDSLYLTDGHHGSSTYYEVPDGGPTLHVHVVVKDNLSATTGSTFWAEMQNRSYTRLKDANGQAITASQLPTALGLSNGMQNDAYRSLVYFTRDIGYSKPTPSTDFLEFYWADWLRTNFPLTSYDLTKIGTVTSNPATDDTGYGNAVWNASTTMVATTDAQVGGMTRAALGTKAQVNDGLAWNDTDGEFSGLIQPISATKPGKIAYMLDYKSRHNIQ
jgi:hypothetical protein